ncbi:MAG: hypothetical protein J5I92_10340 [Thiogranum sp.]|nr:hypothetical protein [Thiogranum sp.]
MVVAATTAAVHTYHDLQGPLDWFLMEILGTLAIVSGAIVCQLLAIRPSAPTGVNIVQRQHEAFFAILGRRVKHFQSPPIDAVRVTMVPELRVAAIPKWVIPLWHTRTLCIGAPLTFFVSESQFRLALAGAVAAGSRAAGGMRAWIVQASRDWPHISRALEQRRSLATRLLLPPARWLTAANQALGMDFLAEQQRTQSRWIMEQAGERAVTEYLAALTLSDAFLGKQYWPMTFKAAERCAEPVVHPFSHFELLLRKSLTADIARRWLLQAQTGRHASRHDFRDLLADLNLDQLHWAGLPEQSAFAAIFGDTTLLKQLDDLWRSMAATEWGQRYARFQQQRSRFEQLQEKSRHQVLRGDSAINYVKLAARFLERADAVTVYRRMQANNLDSAAVCFVCGVQMLAADHIEEGIDALQHAAELDNALANRVHAMIDALRQSSVRQTTARPRIAEIA